MMKLGIRNTGNVSYTSSDGQETPIAVSSQGYPIIVPFMTSMSGASSDTVFGTPVAFGSIGASFGNITGFTAAWEAGLITLCNGTDKNLIYSFDGGTNSAHMVPANSTLTLELSTINRKLGSGFQVAVKHAGVAPTAGYAGGSAHRIAQ